MRWLVVPMLLAVLILGVMAASASSLKVDGGTLQTFSVQLDCEGEYAGSGFCAGPSPEGDE